MSHARARARLQRSLGALTIGVVKGQEKRAAELAPLAASDMIQQVQLDVQGEALPKPVSVQRSISFPHPFLTRLGKASGPENPTFTSGVELRSGGPVMIDVQVTDWFEDDSGLVTGAQVRITAYWPTATARVAFAATVHLKFVGNAVPQTDDSEG